jgi:ribosome maturation factor RimP
MTINNTNPLEQQIENMISPSLDDIGYSLVRVKMIDDSKRKTLQIMIDRKDDAALTVKDCEKASRQISALLDVEDPISGEYNLELSSPGIDRPLMRINDFAKYAGNEIKLSVKIAINGKKNFRGKLLGIEGEKVKLQLPSQDEIIEINFDSITTAKLVLTDELLAVAAKAQ